ncbi:hypothetical protein BN2476_230222 [Paraburkholderia piptadeniae]|uniref:Uncharacterized protein n=1 Tax=Paraburkholderia piptadeniae TaxID=1701573 RepID=A0A1N7RXE9_9BURK|nr:hypothetical protein BN2476_230222 [Paraburkholderia piptadeniae]
MALTAHGAILLTRDAHRAPLHPQRIEHHQAAHQRLADARNHAQRFRRLHRADDAHGRRKHAHRRARDFLERLILRKHARVARRFVVAEIECADLAVETQRRARYERHAVRDARAVYRVARREVVRAVEHDSRLRDGAIEPRVVDAFGHGVYVDIRIQLRDRVASRFDFQPPHRLRDVQDLPLQIGEIHGIGIDERQLADARRRQIHRRWRAEAACADHDCMRVEKALLSLDAEFVDEDVTGVAQKLIVVHGGARRGSYVSRSLETGGGAVLVILIARRKVSSRHGPRRHRGCTVALTCSA